MKTKTPNKSKNVIKPLDIDKLILAGGKHTSPEDGMCIVEAESVHAGLPFGDRLACGSPVIQAFLRRWNDGMNLEDRQQLKRYIGKIAGSRGTPAVEEKRAWMAVDWAIRVGTPIALRAAKLDKFAADLQGLCEINDRKSLKAARPVIDASLEAAREARRKLGYPWYYTSAAEASASAASASAAEAVAAAASAAAVAVVAAEVAAVAAEVAAVAAEVAEVAVAAEAVAVARKIRADLTVSAHDLVERMLAVKE